MIPVHKHNLPMLLATPQPLYPTMNSLQEVLDLGQANLPVMTKNELNSLLMTYHNTLLKVQTK